MAIFGSLAAKFDLGSVIYRHTGGGVDGRDPTIIMFLAAIGDDVAKRLELDIGRIAARHVEIAGLFGDLDGVIDADAIFLSTTME